MKVLVTGCAGLIGSNFCRYLIQLSKDKFNEDQDQGQDQTQQGIEIIGVDNLSGGYIENVPSEVTFVKADLTVEEEQEKLLPYFPVDYIFHFAAYAAEGLSPFIRQYNYKNNVIATTFLINLAIQHSIKRFIFTSSMAVYGNGEVPFTETHLPKPIDPYGVAKYSCEMDLQIAYEQHGLEYCIIRPHNVYGPMQNIWDPYRNVLGIWMLNALENKPFTVYGDGNQTRAFSYIDDILPCLWNAAVFEKAKNQIINVGGMKEISLNDIAKIMNNIIGSTDIVYLEERHEVKHAWCTYDKSIEILNYKEKVPLEIGLKNMWEWVQTSPKRERKYWGKYEIDRQLYSYWKLDHKHFSQS
jgi:UDP-glucose 4-epimerase